MAKYTVRKGDSLITIAKRTGVSYSTLLDANPGVRSISPGIVLTIPTTTVKGGPAGRSGPGAVSPSGNPYNPPTTYNPPTQGPPKSGRKTPSPTPQPQIPIPPTLQPPKGTPYTPTPTVPKTPVAPYVPPDMRQENRQQYPTARFDTELYNAATQARQAIVPTAYNFGQAMAQASLPFLPRVSNILTRLFSSFRTRYPTVPVGTDPYAMLGQGLTRNLNAMQQAPVFGGPADLSQYNEARRLGYRPTETYVPPNQVPRADLSQYNEIRRLGPAADAIAAREGLLPDVGTFGAQGFPLFTGQEGQHPGYSHELGINQRSSILEYYLDNNRLPVIIFEEDVARMGWTDAELLSAGYIQDQFGDWIFGGLEPTGTEQASGGGGRTASTYYPRRGGGGGGGGGRTYSDYVYPQNFVDRELPGGTPTARTLRAARFGAVTWRI